MTDEANPAPQAPSAPSARSLWIESLALFVATVVVIRLARMVEGAGLISSSTTSTVTTIALIYAPLGWILYKKLEFRTFGATFEGWRQSLAVFAVFSLATLPAFYLGNHLLQTFAFHHVFTFRFPKDFGMLVVGELLAVALPEEFFYRGYLQTRLEQATGSPWSFLGARFGWGFLLASVLFAAAHTIVNPQWWHVGIVVPALAFGWLRLRTGSILAPVLFHALCNLSMAIAEASYH